MFYVENEWKEVLEKEFKKEYFKELLKFVNDEYQNFIVYPPYEKVFRAFDLTDFHEIKVVILGQDPYFNENEANGLAFSSDTIRLPASLANIFKELKNDIGVERFCGDLSDWAKQGVFLLNSVLTVRAKSANSHQNHGWEKFTDSVISSINTLNKPIIYILWGNNAKKKRKLITNPKHLVIQSSHPSPLAAYHSFFGSRPFSKVNEYLRKNNEKEITW